MAEIEKFRKDLNKVQIELGHYNKEGCLLYTSDAADERSSVDLGGRRIIKKKKKRTHMSGSRMEINNKMKKRM